MDKIELRSEKVRNIIGDIPSSLTYIGAAVIIIVFAMLIAAVCLIPYPYGGGESILGHYI